MGVMSRKVVPACGNLCFFCPSLRARSRQPVKRYKKLLADIFPRSQDAEPNDRKIGKLCDYASKNPLRIPKITEYLEQLFYKDLRNEHLGSVKIVLLIYMKLLSSCKEQMPLFASSLLGIVRTLLEQSRYDEMVILGCNALIDFLNSQTDSTYMYNLEGLIPKLCQLAGEVGCEDGTLRLRCAGMQVLAALVQFMGVTAHFSMDFDHIITATLENYTELPFYSEDFKVGSKSSTEGFCKAEKHGSSFPDISQKSSKSKMELVASVEAAKNPSYWAKMCLKNMVQLAKEATTVRRVFEPLFHCFDSENHWLPENGLACSVLTYMQSLLEESGERCHLIISVLVKHLDHKSIVKLPNTQINIVKVATELANSARQQASAAIIGSMSDLIKHLRKCMLHSAESSSLPDGSDQWHKNLQIALENCISHLSDKVGDAGPILDMMAMVLENIPTAAVAARASIYAVHRTSQIASSVPNVSYYKKAFPDALFHHLLLAMAHPDHDTRAGAHHIFSTLLMPSLSSIWSIQDRKVSRSLSEQALLKSQKMNSRSVSLLDGSYNRYQCSDAEMREEEFLFTDSNEDRSIQYASHCQSNSFKAAGPEGKKGLTSLRLSSHQVGLLLSSIWMQATSAENMPANFEAMAHTYTIALLFGRSKSSSHRALIRCFQLAFSLRSSSRDDEGRLQPSRRRSLFTLASYMLLFSARAAKFSDLIPAVKTSLTDETVDPFLKLVDDVRLQALSTPPTSGTQRYGSQEDADSALKSLSAIKSGDQQLKELAISHFMSKYKKLSEEELSSMKEQLLLEFAPDDDYPLGVPLFMETPCPSSPVAQFDFQSFDEVNEPEGSTDEDSLVDPSGSQSDRKTSLSITSLDIISVNQLLESVLETARQVASFPVLATPISYDQVKSQCEALVTGKQQKMLALQSFKLQQEMKTCLFAGENGNMDSVLSRTVLELPGDLKFRSIENQDKIHLRCSQAYGLENSLRLPPSSPYDKFLKAAGN